MAEHLICPRCGSRDSFMKGYLPETCVCRICQSQLGWREIPGCGPDCSALKAADEPPARDAAGDAAGNATGDRGEDAGKSGDWDV